MHNDLTVRERPFPSPTCPIARTRKRNCKSLAWSTFQPATCLQVAWLCTKRGDMRGENGIGKVQLMSAIRQSSYLPSTPFPSIYSTALNPSLPDTNLSQNSAPRYHDNAFPQRLLPCFPFHTLYLSPSYPLSATIHLHVYLRPYLHPHPTNKIQTTTPLLPKNKNHSQQYLQQEQPLRLRLPHG